MSQFNGDKARFNRERKQNIERRKRNKALFQAVTSAAEAGKKKGSASPAGKDGK
jgi:hypothetical protein